MIRELRTAEGEHSAFARNTRFFTWQEPKSLNWTLQLFFLTFAPVSLWKIEWKSEKSKQLFYPDALVKRVDNTQRAMNVHRRALQQPFSCWATLCDSPPEISQMENASTTSLITRQRKTSKLQARSCWKDNWIFILISAPNWNWKSWKCTTSRKKRAIARARLKAARIGRFISSHRRL